MLDLDSLYESGTKRCCPRKCGKQIQAYEQTSNNLLISIMRLLHRRVDDLEQRLTDCCTTHTPQLTQLVADCEQRLRDVHIGVQNQLIPHYVTLANRTEEILSEYSEHYDPTISEEQLEQRPAETPPPIPIQTPISSPTPTQSNTPTPTPTPKRHADGCIDIDLCEGLYGWLAHWSKVIWPDILRGINALVVISECCRPPETPQGKEDYPAHYPPETYFVPIGDITESEELPS